MQTPIKHRGNIPFFYNKTESEFQKDPYERYDTMVVRQSSLHLLDEVWGGYPWQGVLDFAIPHYPDIQKENILEIGCGVGRWIGQLAQSNPNTTCWGIDYSYQMLKRAHAFWVQGKGILFDLTNRGFSQNINVQGHHLNNLQLGLAKAENLPFDNNTQDLILNSFLLDRLDDPTKGLQEMYRVLKPDGKLILITPLNFSKAKHWKTYYPPVKTSHILNKIGFNILDWQEGIIIQEPMDLHGNVVTWKCLGLVVEKK